MLWRGLVCTQQVFLERFWVIFEVLDQEELGG